MGGKNATFTTGVVVRVHVKSTCGSFPLEKRLFCQREANYHTIQTVKEQENHFDKTFYLLVGKHYVTSKRMEHDIIIFL